jgi:thioredoxin 1
MDENKEENKVFYKLKFCEGKGDWSAYAKCAQGMIDFYGFENHISSVNNYSWTIYENAEDKDVLNTAIGWMEKVVKLEPLYMYLDTYAALFYKAGQYDKALSWADKAIEIGKVEDENVKETEELREKILAAKAGK